MGKLFEYHEILIFFSSSNALGVWKGICVIKMFPFSHPNELILYDALIRLSTDGFQLRPEKCRERERRQKLIIELR